METTEHCFFECVNQHIEAQQGVARCSNNASSHVPSSRYFILSPPLLLNLPFWMVSKMGKAWNFLGSLVISMARTLLTAGLTGLTALASLTAFDSSSAVASPFRGFLEFGRNKINLKLYSFKRWAFTCKDSTLLFLRR